MNEHLTPRTYDQLNVDEKVLAILGTVYEPVSKEFAFHLGGINYEQLSASDKEKVDAIFTTVETMGVEVIEEGEVEKYRLSDLKRKELAKTVDIVSIHKQTADTMWNDLGGDEAFGIDPENPED